MALFKIDWVQRRKILLLGFSCFGEFVGTIAGVEAGEAGVPLLGSGEALEVGGEIAVAGLGFAVGEEIGGGSAGRFTPLHSPCGVGHRSDERLGRCHWGEYRRRPDRG